MNRPCPFPFHLPVETRYGLSFRTFVRDRSVFAIAAAFAGIYLIWGTTYLGIALALQTIPPFVSSCTRDSRCWTVNGAVLIPPPYRQRRFLR